MPQIVHVAFPYLGDSPLVQRQALFFESVRRAERESVRLVAAVRDPSWSDDNWECAPLGRDASALGDSPFKPFLKDLFDCALERAEDDDWLFYTNADCSIVPDTYRALHQTRGSAVEYMRQDVDGEPQTLEELSSNTRELMPIGIDGLALRASFYREIRDRLPDFVIGEPHWDTTWSGILRTLTPVKRETERLLHPRHKQAWSLYELGPAGKHNEQLYVAAVQRGQVAGPVEPLPVERSDTAVIVVSFGDEPQRLASNVAAVSQQLRQDLYVDFYLLEILQEDSPSNFPEEVLGSVRHIRVADRPERRGLFQKEALFNLGWKRAREEHAYEYFIFVDADIFSKRKDWFRRIRDRLAEQPARAVQGYRVAQDTHDPDWQYTSLGLMRTSGPTDLEVNPGVCWGLHRSTLEMGDGFNPFCITCGGDSAFVAEYLNVGEHMYDPWLYQFHWFHGIRRDLPYRAICDYVDIDVLHVNHGPLAKRNYDGRRHALDGFPPIHELVKLDEEGLLVWRDPDCIERTILEQRARMDSREEVDRLFEEYNYSRVVRNGLPLNPRETEREILPTPDCPRESWSDDPLQAGRLVVFRPYRIYRTAFQFSAADGVRTVGGEKRIPIRFDGSQPTLLLEGLQDAPWAVGMVPLQATWTAVDLSGYDALKLRVRALAGGSPSEVALGARFDDGSETDSARVGLPLDADGETWTELAIPLTDLNAAAEFDPRKARLVKFFGSASMRLEIAEIIIE